MGRNSRTARSSPLAHRIGGLLVAFACAVALSGCGDDNTYVNETPTTGSLNVNVTPASATVVVTGPGIFTQSFTGNRLLSDLVPGDYTASATAPGFFGATSRINVVAGYTSSISLILVAQGPIDDSPRAVYRDGDGNIVPLSPADLQSGQFVFYAWLKDEPLGVLAGELTTLIGDPGKPLLSEQWESAPSFTQNLAVAWVGFLDATGVVRPVIGADVRWEIDQWWEARINSTQFGTSDDNRVALGYGVFDDQADTRTNSASLEAQRFPLIASEYPLYNGTGVGTPFVDGLTWVTLFSPDAVAQSRIVAVATVAGEEIGKQILFKTFAPAPEIVVVKSVDVDLLNLDVGDTVTWTVTVTNVGTGDATSVSLADFLASGGAATYTLASIPPECTAVGDDGFVCDIALPAASTPPPPAPPYLLGNAESFAVLANATVTNTGSSVINGDVGVSAGSAVTGFPPGSVLNGTIHNNDAAAQAAQAALTTAYTNLGARACTAPANTALSNATLGAGVYCYDSSAGLTGPLVLDGGGDPSAEFVFKIGSSLTVAAGSTVTLINGANPCNVYWQLGESATINAGAFFVGNILAQASVTAVTGTSISGRALARVGTVTLDANAVTAPACEPAAPVGDGNQVTLTFTATVTAPGVYCNEIDVLAYSSETDTWIPVELNDQDCFTAVESQLVIVKDFVADDNATSLGQALTVAANVPARLRVRVINSGTGDATAVQVADALDGGALAAYQVLSVSSGTLNTADGFDTTIGDLAAGQTATLFFTVAASADGTYCDTATVSDASGLIDEDSACLTVATPNLVITKVDAPSIVVPGGSYTSTIVVQNTGSATARNVVIKDLLGSLSPAGTVFVTYVSSSQAGAGGVLFGNVVTAPTMVNLAAGASMTFTVVSRIPLAAISGDYCDTATVTSSNAPTKEATDCVFVPAFSALQTQLVDRADPIAVGSDVEFFSVLYVESLSNEGVGENVLTYSFGLDSPTGIGGAGRFLVESTMVYLDIAPVRDPTTGLVVSDASSATALLQTAGTDYTLATVLGRQVITMTANVVLQPNTALYVVHVVSVPAGTPTNRLYTTSYIWDSVGLVDPTHTYEASSSEPTTVLP